MNPRNYKVLHSSMATGVFTTEIPEHFALKTLFWPFNGTQAAKSLHDMELDTDYKSLSGRKFRLLGVRIGLLDQVGGHVAITANTTTDVAGSALFVIPIPSGVGALSNVVVECHFDEIWNAQNFIIANPNNANVMYVQAWGYEYIP